MVHPNADCNLPGSLTIRYSNNIAGVDEVKYQFGTSSSGPWYKENRCPFARSYGEVDLPANIFNDKYVYVRITTKCGTNTRSDWWYLGYKTYVKSLKT